MCQRNRNTRKGEERPLDARKAATGLYLTHAAAIISSFDSWKEEDRFYFIELDLDMTYYLGRHEVLMAEPPYYLGTIVRCSLEHPELFAFPCPSCGESIFAHSFNGSPQSGRIDLSGACPRCGWKGGVEVSGWRSRSTVLRKAQKEDLPRLTKACIGPSHFTPASIVDLLRELGVPDEELITESE